MRYILGIDTSSYTTSVALINEESNEILADERKVLEVKKGQKGLRQQEAVFQHLKNLPELYEKIPYDLSNIKIVSVSSKPRNAENSYMPVFIAGRNFGKVISDTLNCEFLEYSHQEISMNSLQCIYQVVPRNFCLAIKPLKASILKL